MSDIFDVKDLEKKLSTLKKIEKEIKLLESITDLDCNCPDNYKWFLSFILENLFERFKKEINRKKKALEKGIACALASAVGNPQAPHSKKIEKYLEHYNFFWNTFKKFIKLDLSKTEITCRWIEVNFGSSGRTEILRFLWRYIYEDIEKASKIKIENLKKFKATFIKEAFSDYHKLL